MPADMQVVTFASGSTGNCTLVSDSHSHILIDAGISARRICQNLDACGLKISDISAILITHEHADHVSGLATLAKNNDVRICAPRTVASNLCRMIAGVEKCIQKIPVSEAFGIKELEIKAFPTNHDTQQSVGYRISGTGVFSLCTDTGIVTQEIYDGLYGADCVVIESNHDLDMLRNGAYPYFLKKRILSDNGHLSNDACAEVVKSLAQSGTRNILLGHLSRENNLPRLALEASKAAADGTGALIAVAPEGERLTVKLPESGKKLAHA